MTLEYIVGRKTDGANPFHIFEELPAWDADTLASAINKLSYSEFLKSAYWFAVSTVVKARAGMRCQVCNSVNGIGAHHRTYSIHGREHLNMGDLTALCSNCHGLFHGHITSHRERHRQKKEPRIARERRSKEVVRPHTEADIVIPDEDPIRLTRELIDRCRTDAWAFTNATAKALGMTRGQLLHGWVRRMEGATISREKYREAVEGRFIYRAKLD